MNTKHTPTPWAWSASTKTIRSVPTNYWLATMDSFDGAVNNNANAAFIVRACNAHDQLVAFVAQVASGNTEYDELSAAAAALLEIIAKAKEEA